MTACDEQAPRVEYLTAAVPQSIRHCKAAPAWDATLMRAKAQARAATQREVAEFIALLVDAGNDCRVKLAAVDRLLSKVETRTAASKGVKK